MRLSVAIIFYGDYWHMTESLIATVQKTINHPQIYSALCLTSNEEMSGFCGVSWRNAETVVCRRCCRCRGWPLPPANILIIHCCN